jgi:hypothetical protein
MRAASWSIGILLVVAACATRVELPTPLSPSPTRVLIPFAPSSPTLTQTPATLSPTPRSPIPSPIVSPTPRSTPRPLQFGDVEDRALLDALFPDLRFTLTGDAFRVNDDARWSMWITSAVEGQFTQTQFPELAAIIANDAPAISDEQAKRYAPAGSFLAIFQRRESKLIVAQRALLFPLFPPPVFEVVIETTTDFDHDGRDELLATTTAMSFGISTSAAFLYRWDGTSFVSVWSVPIAQDNTGALNQSTYYSIEARVEFADLDADGVDEIIVDSTRVEYGRDAQGLANTDQELDRRSERVIYHWDAKMFVAAPALNAIPTRQP